MASNSFNNLVAITKSAMDVLENNLTFAKYVNRRYAPEFNGHGAKNGDTINVRIPGQYTVRSGPQASPQAYNDTFVPLTVSQKGVDLQFTTAQLLLNVEDGDAFKTNVLQPMIAPLANQVDLDGLLLSNQVWQAAGTPGTPPTDLSSFLTAGAILDEAAVPRDGMRSAIVDPRTQVSLVNGLKGLFHSSTQIEQQYEEGTMGLAAGLKFSMDQNVQSQTFGQLGGTPVVASAPSDGATSVSTSGWTASAAVRMKKGDVFTMAGVFKINPVSKTSTGQFQQFVLTSDASSDGSGNATLNFSPAIKVSGPTQNVTALPAVSAAITPLATSNAVSPMNMVFHRDAFGLVALDLPKPDGIPGSQVVRVRSKKLDIAIRMIQWYDGTQDTDLYRLDLLYGWAAYRPTFACRVQG